MAASSDRNPPPFPAAEETEAGQAAMADGDSDEGEDIFLSKVCSQLGFLDVCARAMAMTALSQVVRAKTSGPLSDLTRSHGFQHTQPPQL